ncbi:MAG TPA: NAD(P)/FAD-dependent oxidoreductase [Marmoricola sp.]|nr:NAD(P)/FAD-dependent oxidoreductase [Marmoricola sp.]
MSAEMSAEVVVVGLGVGGEAVAGQLADAGMDVIGIEHELVGGECPYWGCIPSKMMLRAAGLLAEARRIPGIAGTSTVEPDWAPVAQRIRQEATDTWDDTVAVDRFTGKGGRFVRGKAKILDPRNVEVPGIGAIHAKHGLVISTGTAPTIPPIPGLADTPYWTNRDAVKTEVLPVSLVVIGGGAIGCEIGQAYARFGVEVTIIEGADRLLAMEDPEAGELLDEALRAEGLSLRLGVHVAGVTYDDAFTVRLADGSSVVGEKVLLATGRHPAMNADDWAALELEGRPGALPVDEQMRVRDGVWAVGDITGKGAFTHMATYQADIAVRNILGNGGIGADYRAIPRVVFTDPEIGGVGLTEAQARDRGIRIATGSTQIPSTSRGWIHKAGNTGLIKLIVDTDNDRLVGAISAGPTGGEVLSALCVAVHAEVPVSMLESMIYAYPTFHRGIQDALRDLRAKEF